jgi:flagellar basal-body rod protein FlgC
MADNSVSSSTTQAIAVSALRAQQARMRIIAENLANSNSTSRTPGGDPYRRQAPVFQAATVAGGGKGVKMMRAEPDKAPFNSTFDPNNPSADATGYVKTPNVDPLIEAMDMRDAQRAYEANLNVIETVRSMDSRTLDLLKQ